MATDQQTAIPDAPHHDVLHRFSFDRLPIRGQWVRLTSVLDELSAVRVYPAGVLKTLGEMLASVAMIADNLKFEGAVTLQSKGDGILKRSLAECREHRYLRGIAHLTQDARAVAPDTPFKDYLGQGQLALSLIPSATGSRHMPTPQGTYQGLIELNSSSLAANLQDYFATSEQLQTRLSFAHTTDGSSPGSVTGLLLQRLPSADNATEIALSEADEAWLAITTLAATVRAKELAHLPAARLLRHLFAAYPCRLHSARTLAYKCTCSKTKSDGTLAALGADEVRALLAEQGSIHVDCEFCGVRYAYDEVDVDQLLTEHTPPTLGPYRGQTK